MPDPPSNSWYLDPLAAEQKKSVHLDWIHRSVDGHSRGVLLKTDLFEEANGQDQFFMDLFPNAHSKIGLDVDPPTVRGAAILSQSRIRCLAADVRWLPLRSGTIDLVISNSTLDHFDNASDLDLAIGELSRILSPGGILLVSLDNPHNPLYHVLRWISQRGWTPFRLGHTTTAAALSQMLERAGLKVGRTDYLIHNPRVISTLLFLGLRRMLGGSADAPIRALLGFFALAGKCRARRITACFVAIRASKP